MRARQMPTESKATLSGSERSALREFLGYIEERVRGVEPICADLVRMARLTLNEPAPDHGTGRDAVARHKLH